MPNVAVRGDQGADAFLSRFVVWPIESPNLENGSDRSKPGKTCSLHNFLLQKTQPGNA